MRADLKVVATIDELAPGDFFAAEGRDVLLATGWPTTPVAAGGEHYRTNLDAANAAMLRFGQRVKFVSFRQNEVLVCVPAEEPDLQVQSCRHGQTQGPCRHCGTERYLATVEGGAR